MREEFLVSWVRNVEIIKTPKILRRSGSDVRRRKMVWGLEFLRKIRV